MFPNVSNYMFFLQVKNSDHSNRKNQTESTEEELRNVPLESNQLLQRRSNPIKQDWKNIPLHKIVFNMFFFCSAAHQSENKENTVTVIEVDHTLEITLLNTTIKDLKSKLDPDKNLEEKINQLKTGI